MSKPRNIPNIIYIIFKYANTLCSAKRVFYVDFFSECDEMVAAPGKAARYEMKSFELMPRATGKRNAKNATRAHVFIVHLSVVELFCFGYRRAHFAYN